MRDVKPQARAGELRRRSHVARLYPSAEQSALLDGQGHATRLLWNLIHDWWTWGCASIARRPPPSELDRQIREARRNPLPGWEWFERLPAQACQQVLKDYLRAWGRFGRGLAKPPKYKRRRARMAVDVPQASALNITRLNHRWGELSIPLIEEPAALIPANLGPPVGVDRGVIHTMALSNGEMLDMPRLLTPGERQRLLGLERKAARQQLARTPGARLSARHLRTLDQIARLRAKQAHRREDWLHRKTTDLAKRHGVVVVEDLCIGNLTRSARGTAARPGTNVKAKAGLNRSILGMAWGKAGRMLAYKCPLHGGMLVGVDSRNSSRECARCGFTSAANRPDQANFQCAACKLAMNADTNAARVILRRGLTALSGATPGCGGTAREASTCRTVNRLPIASSSGWLEGIRNPGLEGPGGHQHDGDFFHFHEEKASIDAYATSWARGLGLLDE